MKKAELLVFDDWKREGEFLTYHALIRAFVEYMCKEGSPPTRILLNKEDYIEFLYLTEQDLSINSTKPLLFRGVKVYLIKD